MHGMGVSIEGVRGAVLQESTLRVLDELRGFRHVVRHAYEYDLNVERVKALAAQLPQLLTLLNRDLDRFVTELNRRLQCVDP